VCGVRRRLAENDLKPWRKDMWCIPQVDAEYVARMEDVLDLYAEWMFTIEKARDKMARAYPQPQANSRHIQRVKTSVQRY
jgi:hypothetical protein